MYHHTWAFKWVQGLTLGPHACVANTLPAPSTMFSIRTMITLGKGAGARRGYKGALGTGHQVCSAHENSLAKQVGIVCLFYIKQN